MASSEGFTASFYSEPSVLGLLANVVSAFLVCLQNFSFAASDVQPGGVANILAGEQRTCPLPLSQHCNP